MMNCIALFSFISSIATYENNAKGTLPRPETINHLYRLHYIVARAKGKYYVYSKDPFHATIFMTIL